MINFHPRIQPVELPLKVRVEVELLRKVLEEALAAPHGEKMRAYQASAEEMRRSGHKITAEGIRNLASEYKSSGKNWKMLIDHRKLVHEDHKLPSAFVEEVKRRFTLRSGSLKEAWDALINDWRKGNPIPGYTKNPVPNPDCDHPMGWSYKNLLKLRKRTPFERLTARLAKEKKMKPVREELLEKFETALSSIDALKSNLLQLRIDVLKGNS